MSDRNPNVPDLELATEAWIAVVRAYNDCTTRLSRRLEPLNISLLQHEILMNLSRTPSMTQQQLSERCYSAKSGISMMVSRLEAEGIVERRRSDSDKRAWCLILTRKGEKRAKLADDMQVQTVMEMAAVYSAAELLLIRDRMRETSNLLRQQKEKL